MPDVVLSDGREITFDLALISRAQYRELFNPAQKREDESATIARVAGLTAEEVDSTMSVLDFKRLATAFFKKCREPMNDPKGSDAESSSAS